MSKSTRESFKELLSILEKALNKSNTPTTSTTNPASSSKQLLKELLKSSNLGQETKKLFEQAKADFEKDLKAFDGFSQKFEELFKDLPKHMESLEKALNPDNINGVDKTYQFKKSVIAHADSRITKLTLTNKNIKTTIEFTAEKSDKGYTLKSVSISKEQFIGEAWHALSSKTYDISSLKNRIWDELLSTVPSEFKDVWNRAFKTLQGEFDNTSSTEPNASNSSTTNQTDAKDSAQAPHLQIINLADYNTWPQGVDILMGLSVDAAFTLINSTAALNPLQQKIIYFILWNIQQQNQSITFQSVLNNLQALVEAQNPFSVLNNVLEPLILSPESASYATAFKLELLEAGASMPSLGLQEVYLNLKMLYDTAWSIFKQHQERQTTFVFIPGNSITGYLSEGTKFQVDPYQQGSVLGRFVQTALDLQYAEHAPVDMHDYARITRPAIDLKRASSDQITKAYDEAKRSSLAKEDQAFSNDVADHAHSTTAKAASADPLHDYLSNVIAIHDEYVDRKVHIENVETFEDAKLNTFRVHAYGQQFTKLKIVGTDKESGDKKQTILYAPSIFSANFSDDYEVPNSIQKVVDSGVVLEAVAHDEDYSVMSFEAFDKHTVREDAGEQLYFLIENYQPDTDSITLYLVKVSLE